MYCTACGAEIRPDERFCVSCGTRVALRAPTIGHPVYAPPEQSYAQPEPYPQASYGQATYREAGYPQATYEPATYDSTYQPATYDPTYDQTGYDQTSYDQTGYGQATYGHASYDATPPPGATTGQFPLQRQTSPPYESWPPRQPAWSEEDERDSGLELDLESEPRHRPGLVGAVLVDLVVGVLLVAAAAGIAALVLGKRTGTSLEEFIASRGWVDIGLCAAVLVVYGLAAGLLRNSAGMAIMTGLRGEGGSGASGLVPVVLALVAAGALGGVVGATGSAAGSAGPADAAAYPTLDLTPEPTQTPTPDPAELAKSQVLAIDQVISSSSASKSTLGDALDDVSACRGLSQALADLKAVRDGRAAQLAQAQALVVDAIPNGEAIRDALVLALQHSHSADNAFVAWAENAAATGNCRQNDNYRAGVSRSADAQAAKRAFVNLWNPLARQYGLPERTAPSI